MKHTLTLLAATTALAAAFGAPAVSAMRTVTPDSFGAAVAPAAAPAAPIIKVSDDGERRGFWIFGRGHDDDDEYENEDCDDDDDEGGYGACGGGQPAPAAAGTVAPPANGLFSDGAAPQVQVN